MFRFAAGTYAINFDGASSITYGFMYFDVEERVTRVAEILKERAQLADHPMLAPLLLFETTRTSTADALRSISSRLYQVELSTGQHGWLQKHGQPNSGAIDFGKLTRELNGISMRASGCEYAADVHRLHIETFKKGLRDLPGWKSAAPEAKARREYTTRLLEEHLAYLTSLEQGGLALIGDLKRRIQAQLTVAYNFNLQRDSRVNLEVAIGSKRDSSAMKIIAILTTIFLPGTYVAVSRTMGT